jgi:hypothetical protein
VKGREGEGKVVFKLGLNNSTYLFDCFHLSVEIVEMCLLTNQLFSKYILFTLSLFSANM